MSEGELDEYSDSEDASQTQLPDDVIPECITDAMSMEHVASYLKKNSIPDQYCDAFIGKL